MRLTGRGGRDSPGDGRKAKPRPSYGAGPQESQSTGTGGQRAPRRVARDNKDQHTRCLPTLRGGSQHSSVRKLRVQLRLVKPTNNEGEGLTPARDTKCRTKQSHSLLHGLTVHTFGLVTITDRYRLPPDTSVTTPAGGGQAARSGEGTPVPAHARVCVACSAATQGKELTPILRRTTLRLKTQEAAVGTCDLQTHR